MLNETMIQLILIAICCVYIIFNTKADKTQREDIVRLCTFSLWLVLYPIL